MSAFAIRMLSEPIQPAVMAGDKDAEAATKAAEEEPSVLPKDVPSDDDEDDAADGEEEGAEGKGEGAAGRKRKGAPGAKQQKRPRADAPSSEELMTQAAAGFGFVLHASGGTAVTGTMQVPQAYVGNIIGKGGFTIKCVLSGRWCSPFAKYFGVMCPMHMRTSASVFCAHLTRFIQSTPARTPGTSSRGLGAML